MFAHAAGLFEETIKSKVDLIVSEFITPIILVIYSLAILLFFWGLVTFIRNTDNPEARKTGLQHMGWGIVGILIITSSYAILAFIAKTLGVSLPIF